MAEEQHNKNKLFNDKVLDIYAKRVNITKEQKEALKLWVNKLNKKELVDETSNYPIFKDIVLQAILGYSLNDIGFEEGNVEYTIKDQNGQPLLPIELKGQNDDLFKRQGSRGKTAVEQAHGYALEKNSKYFAASNYASMVFLLKETYYSKYEIFDFVEMLNDENEFKKFILLFSRQYLVKQNMPELIRSKVIQNEKEFTKEFYKIYHETRLMIIKELEDLNSLPKEKAIHYSQVLLNRIMFICFAQDSEKQLLKELTLENAVLKPIERHEIGEHTHDIWNSLIKLFNSIRLGDRINDIPQYNGGLFLELIPENIKLRDIPPTKDYFSNLKQGSKYTDYDINSTIKEKLGRYIEELNPIYKNILLLSSFDFKTEVDVNILGHIFEQSIGDIEDLKSEKVSQRKKFGVFYTPEYITDYICKTTIISYLSKTGSSKEVSDLLFEYSDDLDELELKLKNIKILDPACGSGAFLNKAVDILLDIHRGLFEFKDFQGRYNTKVKQRIGRKKHEEPGFSLKKFFDDIEQQRGIILNNIYGVDINEESVEITKLSLFLKIASRGITLPNLDQNIKCGNSLVEDPSKDKKAFKWNKQFEEIMNGGGFDVVVGNPPYVQKHKSDRIEGYEWNSDLYLMFFERIFKLPLLKTNGFFGFITPRFFLVNKNCKNFRKHILTSENLIILVESSPFEDSNTECVISIIQHSSSKSNIIEVFEDFDGNIEKVNTIKKSVALKDDNYTIITDLDDFTYDLLLKIENDAVPLVSISESRRGMEIGKKNLKNGEIKTLIGQDVKRYSINFENTFVESENKQYLRLKNFFDKGKKLYLRRVAKYLIATTSDLNYAFNKNIYGILITDKKYNLNYVLALLNSELFTFYYIRRFSTKKGDLFPEIQSYLYNKLPIREIGESQQKLISDKVDQILLSEEKKKELRQQIDELIYDIYKITPEEKEFIKKSLREYLGF